MVKVFLVLIMGQSVAVVPQSLNIESCVSLGKEWVERMPFANFRCVGVAQLGGNAERTFIFDGTEKE